MDDLLRQFKKVQRVEAPPFLLTRINAKIKEQQADQLPASWKWAGAFALGLLLFANSPAMSTGRTPSTTAAGQFAESIGLITSNQLYNE